MNLIQYLALAAGVAQAVLDALCPNDYKANLASPKLTMLQF